MSNAKRIRRVFSVKEELLKNSSEAALAAVHVFNNPNVTFWSETHVVLMIIAWRVTHSLEIAPGEVGAKRAEDGLVVQALVQRSPERFRAASRRKLEN